MNIKPNHLTKHFIIWLVATTFFMEALDGAVINVAVAPIAFSLHVHPLMLKLAVMSYLISLGVFIPISGWMADRFGLRNIYGVAILLFGLGSLACGLSHNLTQLVIARVVQGIGGSMMNPVGRLLYLRAFDRSELVKVMSYVMAPAFIGPMMGPIVSGLFITYLSWRWIFFINIPFVIFGLFMVFVFVDNHKADVRRSFDWLGFVFLGGGIGCLSFGLAGVGQHSLPAIDEVWLLGLGVLGVLAYLINQRFVRHPMINPIIFKARTFKIAMIAGFLSRLGSSLFFILPLMFQLVFHYSAFKTGLYMAATGPGAIMMKLLTKNLFARVSMRKILICNAGILFLLTLTFCFFSASTSPYFIVLVLFSYGLFVVLHFSAFQVLNYAEAEKEHMSQYSSFVASMQKIATSFSVALVAGLLAGFMYINHTAPILTMRAFELTFVCQAFLIFLPALILLLLPRDAASAATGYKVRH